jgi:hypothetical protein
VRGIALLRELPRAIPLTRAAAVSAVPVFVLIGKFIWGLAGWPVTILGLVWPVVLFVYTGKGRSHATRLAAH